MSLKNAALLAFVGMILLTLVVALDFVNITVGFVRDVVPAIALLRSLVYLLASLGVVLFLYAFHKSQP